MKKPVFISAGVALATTGKISDLTAGKIGVFSYKDGVHKVYADGDTPETGDWVYVGLGRQPNEFKWQSGYMSTKPQYLRFRKSAPHAGTKARLDLRFIRTSGSGALGVSGWDAWIVRTSARYGGDFFGQERNAVTTEVNGVFADEAALYTALAAEINKNPNVDVVASSTTQGGNAVLRLEAKLLNQLIDVGGEWIPDKASKAYDSVVYNAVKSTIVEPVFESGTVNHLNALQRKYLGTNTGNMNYAEVDLRVPTQGSPSGTYTIYTLEVRNPEHPREDQGIVFGVEILTQVAFPVDGGTGAAAGAAYETAIEALFATTCTAITEV